MPEPDPWFVHELKCISERLRVRWDRSRRCFIVEEHRPRIGADVWGFVMACADERGHAVEPGEWALTYLREHDFWRTRGGMLGYIHALEERNARLREHAAADAADDRKHRAYELFPWIQDELDGHPAQHQVWYFGKKAG